MPTDAELVERVLELERQRTAIQDEITTLVLARHDVDAALNEARAAVRMARWAELQAAVQ